MTPKSSHLSKWSWLQFLISGPVAFGLSYAVLSSESGGDPLWVALGIGAGVGLLAGRFGSAAWQLFGDLGSSV